MGKGERCGAPTDGMTRIDTSTDVIKGKLYYYNIIGYNLRMSKHIGVS